MSQTIKRASMAVITLLLIFVMGISTELQATHIVGGTMSFTCNGQEWYEISMTIRRDCEFGAEDAPFDELARVGIFDAYGNPLNFLGNLGDLYMPIVERDTIEPKLPDCGYFGNPVCVEEATYRAKIWLPFREKGYVLAYQRCCRNQTLNNIVSPLETGGTWFVCLTEETLTQGNSSPYFGEWPEIIICQDEPYVFDHSAMETLLQCEKDPSLWSTGDSLAYHLFTPFIGATIDDPKPIDVQGPPYDTLEYSDGYGLDNLLGGVPLTIDPVTGIITATPNSVGQFLVGILVEEWRGGVLLSKVRRDFEINVRACNVIPDIGFETDSELNCENLTVEVENTSVDMYDFVWNFNYPSEDSSFISTEKNPPPFTYSEPGTYTIRLSSANPDNDCEVVVDREVSLFESNLSASFEYEVSACAPSDPGLFNITLNSTSQEPDTLYEIESLLWTANVEGVLQTGTMDTFVVDAACAEEVLVTLLVTSSNGCMSDTSALIKLFDGDTLTAPMDTLTICEGGMVALLSKSPPANGSILYDWGSADLIINDTETNADAKAMPDSTTLYEVKVSFGSRVAEGFVLVVVIPPPAIELPDTLTICEGSGDTILIENTDALTLTWSPLEGIDVSDPSNPVFNPDSSTLYQVVVSNGACEITDSIFIEVIQVDQACIDLAGVVLTKGNLILTADTCSFSFSFNSDELKESCGVESADWTLDLGNEIIRGSGLTFEGQFTKDNCEGIIALLNLTLKGQGDCILGQYLDTISVQLEPDLILLGKDCLNPDGCGDDPLELCEGENANLVVNYNECFLYGISVTGDLDIIGPGSDSLILGYVPGIFVRGSGTITVTVSNGTTSISQSRNIIVVPPVSLSIETDSLICDGVINVKAIPSDGSTDLIYEWSLSSDFDSSGIIGRNMTETLAVSGDTTIYLRATGRTANDQLFCGSNVVSIQVVDESLNLEVISDTLNICTSPIGMVVVIDLETGLPDSTIVWSTSESMNIEGDPTDNPLTVRALEGQNEIILTYSTNHPAGCNSSGQVIIPLVGQVEVSINAEDTIACSSTINLSAEASLPVMPFEWSLSASFQQIVATGDEVEIDLSAGLNTIYVRATTLDTCDSGIDSINIFNGMLKPLIDFQPINRCISSETIVFFNSPDPDQQIDSIWFEPNDNIVEIFPNNSVRVLAPEGQSSIEILYTVLSSSGCEFSDTLTIEVFDDLDVSVSSVDSKICDGTGKFVAEVNAPIDSVMIMWSFDAEFTEVVGTGQEILINVPSTEERIYVMVSSPNHPDCTPDTDSALLEDLRFKGTPVFSPLNLCIADFTDVLIETNCPGQTAQVVWAPSENIEGNLTDNPVRVKAMGSEDTIRLSYTVSLMLAEGVVCTDSGIVSIPVFTDLAIEIKGDPGVCNGVGYFEGIVNANPDDVIISWSFSSDFSEIIVVGKRAEVNILEGASTIYASIAGVGDCPGSVVSLSLDEVTFTAIAEYESINRCISETGQVTLTNSFTDLPMEVIWEPSDHILGGLTNNPQTVTALPGVDEIVVVYSASTTLENGQVCMTMDTVRIEVSDNLDISVSADSKICDETGRFIAEVNAPIDSVTIIWSFDPDFTDTLGIGQEILVAVPDEAVQIYVMVSAPNHPDCTPDTDSVLLEDLRFKGTPVFSPLNLCIADFTEVFIETNCPGQTAQVVWAPSDNIEGSLTDNPVRVKVVGSEDTIRLSYTVTGMLAEGILCVDSGTVSIPVYNDLTIEIIGVPGVCNGVGNFEGIVNANPDSVIITWSFTSDFAQVIAFGKRAEVNIPEGANTIYAAIAGVGDCPGSVASLSLDEVTFKAIAEYEPINRCISETGQVTLVNSFVGLPLSVMWEASDNILGDLTDNPQSVIALAGQEEIVLFYTASTTLEDGTECMTMDSVRIEVSDDLEINISATDLICNGIGSFVAEVNAPLDSVFIEWSFSPTFDVIVGTGDSLTVEIPTGAEIIYVRTDALNPNKCTAASNSFDLADARYNPLVEFEPIDRCNSNSTIVTIRDRVSGELIQLVWDTTTNLSGDLTANPIEVTALDGQVEVLLTYSTVFGDNCNFSGEVLIPVLPGVDVQIIGPQDTAACSSSIILNAESSSPVTAYEWSLTASFDEIIASGGEVEIELLKGDNKIFVRGTTPDSCSTGTDSINVSFTVPDVTPKFDPINRCISLETIVMVCNNDPQQNLGTIEFLFNQNISRILSDTSVMVMAMEGDTSIRIIYRAINEAGCVTIDTIDIEVSDDLEVDIRPTSIICNGFGNFVAEVNAPLDSVLVEWSFSADFEVIAGTGDSLSTAIPDGAEKIYVRTDALNPEKCTEAMDSLNLADITFDPVGQFEPINLCFSAITEVSLIDNITGELVTVQWDSSANLSGDLTVNPIEVTALEGQSEVVLYYMATDSSGDCTISDSLTIPVATVSVCDLTLVGTDNIYCAGGVENINSIAIEGNCPGVEFIYEWGPSDLIVSGGNTANPVIRTPDADNIALSVRVTDGSTGCELLDTSFVLDLLKISVSISADPGTTIKCGEPLALTATTDALSPIFIWDGNPAINTQVYSPDPPPMETTTYSVEVIDVNGCRASASQLITVIIPECIEDVFIPSAFSPNGDGINDVLAVRGNKIDEMELQIYNRWGQEVFRALNQRETWNGQFQNDGDLLHPDVFAYQLMVTCTDGVQIHLSGNVSLLR